MRICLLTTATTAHRMGGTEVHAENLAAEAARQGHDVSVITTAHPSGLTTETKDRITFHFLPGTNPAMSRKWAEAWWRHSSEKIRELHDLTKFDVIWAEGAAGQHYAAKEKVSLGVPLITIIQGMGLRGEIVSRWNDINSAAALFSFFTVYAGQIVLSYLPWTYSAIKRADRVVAISEETAKEISREFRLPQAKVRVIFDGVDTALFKPDAGRRASFRARFGIGPDETLILMSGVATKQKGFHLGLEAFSRLKAGRRTRLLLAGDGPALPALKEKAEALGISSRTVFAGRIDNREMPGAYNSADIYINPTTRMEGLGIAIVEAMACGLPSIVSRIGGTGSTIRNGESGFFVDSGDIAAIAGRIDSLLADAGLAARLAAGARARALAHFSLEGMTESYLELSREISAGTG